MRGGIHVIIRHSIILLACALLLGGCGGGSTSSQTGGSETTGTSSPATSEGHAANIVPGSYEDWCEDHQVPETQCTRCDPSLSAAFQAAGDWDAEHGLPMSQCLKCNPDLKIVRPPKPEGK